MEPDTDITKALEALGIEPTQTNVEQMRVHVGAMNIFIERNTRYSDLWKKYGVKDSLSHMRSKLARTEHSYEAQGKLFSTDLDDAYDLINYTVFCVRNAMGDES